MTKRKNFSNWKKWQKTTFSQESMGNSWCTQISEAWTYNGNMNFVVQKRVFTCKLGTMEHIIIQKISRKNILSGNLFDSIEPTYADKLNIRKIIEKENQDMIEIFPKESTLVDAANLYHLWVLPKDYQFPFSIEYPEEITYEESGYFYDIRFGVKEIQTEYGKLIVLLIKSKNGTWIPWKAKQEIKDDLIGIEKTAIELIPKNISFMKEGECYIIGLPSKFQLPFGLREEKEQMC